MDVYIQVSLLDLNGINTRYQARLNAYGIFTPLEFYNAPLDLLRRQVFRSINGYYWYLRLRGHEIEARGQSGCATVFGRGCPRSANRMSLVSIHRKAFAPVRPRAYIAGAAREAARD